MYVYVCVEWDFAALVQSCREVFRQHCLQTSRLHATASAWRCALATQLEADEEIGVQWAAWHVLIADRLLEVDWAAWLAPESALHVPAMSTLRDAFVILSWLSFELVSVPGLPPPVRLLSAWEWIMMRRQLALIMLP